MAHFSIRPIIVVELATRTDFGIRLTIDMIVGISHLKSTKLIIIILSLVVLLLTQGIDPKQT
jgi:hypothetical protein